MIKRMFVLRDKTAGMYGNPMFVPSIGVLVRELGDEVRRPGNDALMAKHPGDFALFEVGSFDDETCEFVVLDDPVFVLEVATFVETAAA